MAAVSEIKLLKLHIKTGTYKSEDVISFIKDLEATLEEVGELMLSKTVVFMDNATTHT